MSPNDGDSSRVVVLEVVVVVLVVVVVVVAVTTSSSSSSSISISSSSSSRSSVSRSRRLGGESNREIVFVSFVRACVRSCVCLRGTMLLPIAGVADVRKSVLCVCARALPSLS